MRKHKAKNVLEGQEQGFSSLFGGVADGITGVVTQPFKGAKAKGIGGFFKGVGKGITGLVVKPVSGIFDTISKTAEVNYHTIFFFKF